jgi:hypothetical protein
MTKEMEQNEAAGQSASRKSLLELLASWEPIEEEFPEIKDLPPEPVELASDEELCSQEEWDRASNRLFPRRPPQPVSRVGLGLRRDDRTQQEEE